MPPLPVQLSTSTSDEPTWRRGNSENAHNSNTKRAWIIVAGVAALLVLGTCIALAAISISKRRKTKKQLEEARRLDPCLGQKEFSRRRRMTREHLILEAEGQREAMINKSLASRSQRSSSMSSRLTYEQRSMTGGSGTAGSWAGDGCGLSNEKSWEARLSRPSSASSFGRVRSLSPFPDLPAPTLSRSCSPHRLAQTGVGQPEVPPSLEQHPLFQRAGEGSEEDEAFGVPRLSSGTRMTSG